MDNERASRLILLLILTVIVAGLFIVYAGGEASGQVPTSTPEIPGRYNCTAYPGYPGPTPDPRCDYSYLPVQFESSLPLPTSTPVFPPDIVLPAPTRSPFDVDVYATSTPRGAQPTYTAEPPGIGG